MKQIKNNIKLVVSIILILANVVGLAFNVKYIHTLNEILIYVLSAIIVAHMGIKLRNNIKKELDNE